MDINLLGIKKGVRDRNILKKEKVMWMDVEVVLYFSSIWRNNVFFELLFKDYKFIFRKVVL